MKKDNKKQNPTIGFEGLKEKEYGEIHKCVSLEIKKRKQDLQLCVDEQLLDYFNGISHEDPLEKFCYALSEEMQWLNANKRIYGGNVCAKHYGYFIHALLKHKSMAGLKILDAETFFNCISIVSQSIKCQFSVGKTLADYLRFMENDYEFYFFDESTIPIKNDEELFVFQKPIDFYHKWLNSCRPDILLAFAKIRMYELKNDKNFEFDLSDIPATMYLLNILQLSDCQFESKSGKGLPYADVLTNIRWFCQSHDKITFREDDTSLFVLDKKEYDSIGMNSKVDFIDFCDIFAYNVNDRQPFVPKVRPFVRIGDVMFCPSVILSNYDYVYGFIEAFNVNVTSNNKKQFERSRKLEEQLCKKLQNENWEVIPYFRTKEKLDGDADIVLRDKTDVLLIQIKKQNFRTDSRRKYEDWVHLDEKAAKQLNDFEKSHPLICDKNKRVTKWIVSSFDNCRNDIYGCRKVSYLDLFCWYRTNDFQNLSQFIDAVQSDKPLHDIIDVLKKEQSDFLQEELGKALPIVDPQSYIRRIKSNKGNDYFKWVGGLIEKFEWADSKEKLTIIETIRKESDNHPDDYMLLMYLGACLWNIEDYSGADESLKKVLEIVPDEPCTMMALYNLYTQTPWRLRCDMSRFSYIKEEAEKIDKRFKELYWFVDEKNPKLDILIKSFNR